MLMQGIQDTLRAPNFWPIALTSMLLGIVLTTWTLLSRISDRFNKALDVKLEPLMTQIRHFGTEAIRLEEHFDESIRQVEIRNKKDITEAIMSVRSEIAAAMNKARDMELRATENRTLIETHSRELHESKVDRTQLRRDSDAQKHQLDAIEKAQDNSREKILDAIDGAKTVLGSAQGDLSTRLTRVEEALKFYAKNRLDLS